MAAIHAISISQEKGVRKQNVAQAELVAEHGINGDAHVGTWHRQVSLLALESIQKMQAMGLDVGAGDFAENLTTEGLTLMSLPLKTRLKIGAEAVLEITQHGKECHSRCAIYEQAGDCVMPREGVFARVITGGTIRQQDVIEVLK